MATRRWSSAESSGMAWQASWWNFSEWRYLGKKIPQALVAVVFSHPFSCSIESETSRFVVSQVPESGPGAPVFLPGLLCSGAEAGPVQANRRSFDSLALRARSLRMTEQEMEAGIPGPEGRCSLPRTARSRAHGRLADQDLVATIG